MTEPQRRRINENLRALENKVLALFGATYVNALNIPEIKAAVNAEDDEFDWSKYKGAEGKIEKMLRKLSLDLNTLVTSAVAAEYEHGADGAFKEVGSMLGKTKAQRELVEQVCEQATNQRREQGHTGWNYVQGRRGGLTLSERIWQSTRQAKQELRIMVQSGVIEGKTAQEISQDVRPNLIEPKRLFRRVRDKETGELRLSKAAKEYHPGQGVYRSSFKNAMRVARTEVNQAYRVGEQQSYTNNPLVKGYEIMTSENNHTTTTTNGKKVPLKDICDRLAGIYPKTFVWSGWHPNCRCKMVPIPLTPEEFGEYMRKKKAGKLNEWRDPSVKTMPKNFNDWVKEHDESIQEAADRHKLPYFLVDNPRTWGAGAPTPAELAAQRHAARTKEMEDDIRRRWQERRHERIVEYSELKYIGNMLEAVSQYLGHGFEADRKRLREDVAEALAKGDRAEAMRLVSKERALIKSTIAQARETVDKAATFLSPDDIAKQHAEIDRLKAEKNLTAISNTYNKIEGMRARVDSWKDTIENPTEATKTYGMDIVEAAVSGLRTSDSTLSHVPLRPRLAYLEEYEKIAPTPLLKKEYRRRIQEVELDIKVEDLSAKAAPVMMAADSSPFASLKEKAEKIKSHLSAKSVELAESSIRDAEMLMNAISRYEALSAYSTKSAKFAKAMQDARTALEAGNISTGHEMLNEADKIKAVLEASKAYTKGKRAAAKEAKSKPETKEQGDIQHGTNVNDTAYVHKTLDDLKSELGTKLPKTLSVLDKTMAKYEKTQKYGEDAKRYKDEIEATMAELFDKHDYGMNIKSHVLELVMNSWFKNTFETGTSGGYKGSSKTEGKIETDHSRLGCSHRLFMNGRALNDQLERGEYEKYGNLLDHDIKRSLTKYNAAAQYGEVEVRFKKGKVIATWTAGDSLCERYQPSLTTDPKACSYDKVPLGVLPKKGTQTDNMTVFRDKNIYSYLELQYHGQVTADCVESVAFRTDINMSTQDKRTADLCAKKGIKVYHMVKGKLEVYADGKSMEQRVAEVDEFNSVIDTYLSKDISGTKFKEALKRGDYMGASVIKDEIVKESSMLRARADALIDLIPDVHEQHKDFTIVELEAAHKAIAAKMAYIEKKYPGNLQKQADQLLFDSNYLDDPKNRKHATWKIAKDAYDRKRAEIITQIKKEDVVKKLEVVKSYKSRLKDVTTAIREAEALIAAGDYDGASEKIAKANSAYTASVSRKGPKLKIGESAMRVFSSEAFSEARKAAAAWAKDEKNPQKAFNTIDKIMTEYASDLWGRLTDDEKHLLFLYTKGSRWVNEPFFTTYSAKKIGLDGKTRNSERDINSLTSIIEKAKPLEHDMWVQHAEDFGAFTVRFGLTEADLNKRGKAIGVEGVNDPFMSTSCAKHSYFTKESIYRGGKMPIVMSIYLPRGTKGVYCEPFAAWGDGRTGSDVTERYGDDGVKWDGKPRQNAGKNAGDQVEFLLQRGAKLRITNVEVKDGRYYVECELVEQTAVSAVKTITTPAGVKIKT